MSPLDLSQYKHSFGLKNKGARLLWNLISALFFRPFASRIFKKWRVLVLKCFGAKIAWSSHVYASVKIWAPWHLKMGEYSCLGPKVDCYNQGRISIGKNTVVSQKTYLCASTHDYRKKDFPLITKPIVIGEGVWIAADCFIGPGVFIEERAIIAARSAVFKDVERECVFGGNPAKFIKKRT